MKEYHSKFFELAMRTILYEIEILVVMFRFCIIKCIEDELVGHRYLTIEKLHRHAMEVETKLKRKTSSAHSYP